MEIYITGTVIRTIFENPNSFFKILLLDIEDTDSDFDDFEIIVTGTMADIIENETYTFWGELTQHPKYGEQLQANRYERAKPTSNGLVNYLSSEHFKGIGKKTAEKIVALYGENTIDNILNDPSKLDQITGLSKINKERFVATLKTNYGTEKILSELAQYNLTLKLAVQIFNKYKDQALDIIQTNPYQLVEDIQGIGFKMADQIAEKIGIDSQAPERFRAGIIHRLLEYSIETGDTYIEARQLLEQTITLLEYSRPVEIVPEAVAKELSHLIEEDKIQNSDTKIFYNSLFFAEEGIANQLKRILETPLERKHQIEEIKQTIQEIEEEFNLQYDHTQKEAIHKALNSKCFILTGGPGTGKTTVINGFIQAYAKLNKINLKKSNLPIVLAAPTGRAARRMNELTGLPSATIHRHIGLNSDNDTQTIDDYLDCDLIIIDEFSMVDTWLANNLFHAINSQTQVIIVGDKDQLPSVGPGQVLSDLLQVPNIPKVSLTKIFRQSSDSTIVHLASQINHGELPPDFTQKKADRSYFEATAPFISEMTSKIVTAALNSGIETSEIQILAPMYKGQAGITALNHMMQNLINPLRSDDIEFPSNDLVFRKGDKILHLVNDAESNVFNGDIGYITDLVPAKYTESKQDEIHLNFDGIEVIYPKNDWIKITLAYAMSIHKSQGSEFQVVILPITSQSSRMLQRNLIYTAITRSKSKLILLGELKAFAYAIEHQASRRQTWLIERFTGENTSNSEEAVTEETADEYKKTYRLTPDNYLTIDPMIGITQEDIGTIFIPSQTTN